MEVHELIGIAQIEDDAVLLKDNSLIAVLQIHPIKYDALDSRKKAKVDNIYKEWLDSLTYPVQIVSRRLNADVREQAKVIKNKVEYTIKQKEEYRELLKLYKDFESWLDNYLKKKTKQKTIYYLVMPVFSTRDMLKGVTKKKTTDDYRLALEVLNKRVYHAIKNLSGTGVKITRLNDKMLENLYNSYEGVTLFTDSYQNPERWIEIWRSSDDFQKKQ